MLITALLLPDFWGQIKFPSVLDGTGMWNQVVCDIRHMDWADTTHLACEVRSQEPSDIDYVQIICLKCHFNFRIFSTKLVIRNEL